MAREQSVEIRERPEEAASEQSNEVTRERQYEVVRKPQEEEAIEQLEEVRGVALGGRGERRAQRPAVY